jgi:hypothetical protein
MKKSFKGTLEELFKGTLEELMDELPTDAISPVYQICENNKYPEHRIINVEIVRHCCQATKLIVW